MKVLYLGSNEKKKKMQEKNKDEIEARFVESKQKMNTLNIKC